MAFKYSGVLITLHYFLNIVKTQSIFSLVYYKCFRISCPTVCKELFLSPFFFSLS